MCFSNSTVIIVVIVFLCVPSIPVGGVIHLVGQHITGIVTEVI